MKENIEIWIIEVMCGIVLILVGLLFLIDCGLRIFNGEDNFTRIASIPFFICGLPILMKGITYLIKGLNFKKALSDDNVLAEDVFENEDKLNNVDKVWDKLYFVFFLLMWFGFLIAFDYVAIKNCEFSMFIFSLLFWAAGILLAIKIFRR